MATTVGALSVDLDLNSASFINGMKKATDAVTTSSRSIDRALGVAKGAVKGFVAAFAVDQLAGLVSRGLDFAASLGEQSQQLGVTTRDLQVYRYAASQVGIAQEDMEKGLAKLTLNLGKIQEGAKGPTDALRALGFSTQEIARISTMSAGAALPVLADAFAKIESPAKRAAIEVELFGKAGQKIDNLLSGGSGAVNELAAAADKLGIVLSDEAIQKADETADKLSAMKQVLEARIASVVAENADSILQLADAAATLTGAMLKGIPAAINYYSGLRDIYKKDGLFAGLKETFFGTDESAQNTAARGAAKAGTFRMKGFIDPTAPAKATRVSAGGGGGGAGGAGGGAGGRGGGRSGPSLAEQFGSLEGQLDPLKRANDEYKKTIELLDKAEASGLKAAHGFDALRAAARDNLLDDLGLKEIPPTIAETNSLLDDMKINIDDLSISVPKLGNVLDDAFSSATIAAGDGLINGLENLRRGFGSLQDVALSVLDSITSAFLDALVYGPIKDFFSGLASGGGAGGGGGLFGSILSGVSSLFGGGRAIGGSVAPGKFYMTGENGPELFAPGGTGGSILSNSMLRAMGRGEGGGGVTMNFNGPVSNPEQVRRSGAQVGAQLLRLNAAGKRGV
jgi:hypothetical protein